MGNVYMLFFGVAGAVTVVALIKTLEPGHPEFTLTMRVAFGAALTFMLMLLLGALGVLDAELIFRILTYAAAFLWAIWVMEVFLPAPLLKNAHDRKKSESAMNNTEPGKTEGTVTQLTNPYSEPE